MLAMWDVNLKIMWKEKKNPKQRGSAWNARFLTWNGYFLTWFQRGSSVVPHTKKSKSSLGKFGELRTFWGPKWNVVPWIAIHCSSCPFSHWHRWKGKSIIWNIKPLFGTDQQPVWWQLVWAGCGVPKPKGEGLWTQWQLPLLLQRCDRRKPKRWPVPALPRPRHRSLGPAGASHEARAVAGIFSWFSYWSGLANIHLRWATICHIHRNENPTSPSINGDKMLSIFVMKKWSHFFTVGAPCDRCVSR